MVDMLEIHEYSHYVACGLCMLINFFLLFIVQNYTNDQMLKFGSIITQTIIVDMISSISMMLVQLKLESYRGVIYSGTGNTWFKLPDQLQCLVLMYYTTTNSINIWTVPIQAIFRYLSVTRKKKFRFWYPCAIFVIVGTPSFFWGLMINFKSIPIEGTEVQVNLQNMGFWKNRNTNLFCAFPAFSWQTFCCCLNIIITKLSGVILTLCITRRLKRALKQTKKHLSQKTLRIHSEMTRKMRAQTVVPACLTILGICLCTMNFVIPEYYGGLFIALVIPYPWIVVLNPILTICLIQRYRTVAWALICGQKPVISRKNFGSSVKKIFTIKKTMVETVN